jgi:hypothetical protein
MADDLLRSSKGENVDFSRYTPEERRAMTHLTTITQIAEQHPRRTPGSAAFARGSLRNIRDGTSTFHEEFNRKDGHYVAARKKGTNKMKEFVKGNLSEAGPKYTAANMSDDEDNSSGQPESSRRRDTLPEGSRQVRTNKGKERAE